MRGLVSTIYVRPQAAVFSFRISIEMRVSIVCLNTLGSPFVKPPYQALYRWSSLSNPTFPWNEGCRFGIHPPFEAAWGSS